MTDAAAPATQPDDSSPLEPSRLLDLFTRPRRFFDPVHKLDRKPELYLVVWLTGIATVLDRFDLRLSQATLEGGPGSNDFLVRLAESWTSVWVAVLVMGIVSGGFGWLIGGWWYGVRLHLSGAPKGHEREGRLTWAYVSLITSLPTFAVLLYETLRYSSYLEAFQAADLASLALLALVYWSVVVSYQGATTRFKLTPAKARLWFLILPLVIYTALFFLFGVFAAFTATDAPTVST